MSSSQPDLFWTRARILRGALAVSVVLLLALIAARIDLLRALPEGWTFDPGPPLSEALLWLSREAGIGGLKLSSVTRAMGAAVSQPYELLKGVFATGFVFYPEAGGKWELPALPWAAITAVFVLVAHHFAGRRLALWTGAGFLFFAAFGIWESAMLTLTLVGVAVLFSSALGLLLGLWGCRRPAVDRALQPLYDIMQTLPLFSYLVPMILFFGFGPVASLVATVVFALPPMARITTQALRAVHPSVKEFGRMAGCSPRQQDWRVLIPAARKGLLLGVNQVIMLSVSVVVVSSLIGAGGLGGDVLRALKSMRIGEALVAGVAVTVLAILLDRISHAIAMRRPTHWERPPSWAERHALALKCGGALAGLSLLALWIPALQVFPEPWQVDAGRGVNDAVSWLSRTYYAELGAIRDAFILGLLKPVKLFLTGLPWAVVVTFVTVLGYLLKGWRLAGLGAAVFLAILLAGYWSKAMLSLYLVLVSVGFATVLGMALGVLGSFSRPLRVFLIALVDTLQTMPMFVYLIPVVMLFSVGEFPAFVAIVAYAVTPAIRYTIAALEGERPSLIDGARMSGCTGWQMLWRVRVPLGLPVLLLGVNQVIMLAFGMLVITALVGTRGLEEITLTAIAKVDAGTGLLAGLAIAGMAIVCDRYLRALTETVAYYMGVPLERGR
ncbi:MAG: ABC transporter permease subunit [Silicimonas sp.]|nr:ABC transporter permease subunit [Silicimonas sp.]